MLPTVLDGLALYDIVEMVSTRPFWYDEGCTAVDTFTYLQTANPEIKLMGVFHSYGFNNPLDFSATCQKPVRDMFTAYDTANGTGGDWHMLNDVGGQITWPGGALDNQVVLNWSTAQPDANAGNNLGKWWGEYVTGANFEDKGWDGVILEAVPVPASLPGQSTADSDENSFSDFHEAGKGRAFLNAAQYAGWNLAFERIHDNTDLVLMGDGGWQPNPTGIDDVPAMSSYLDIVQDFGWPTDIATTTQVWNCE
jgi:hypothetical protein